ncbi:MAG: tripartite tricarboxylate transporter permease [Candidatus Binatia bacterium]
MIEAATQAAAALVSPERIAFLFIGVVMGLILGAIPGLGGLIGLTILIPFTFDFDPTVALPMLIGLLAVNTTSDTIPGVLFGVPGTAASQATILDGYPMAQRGEAGRAFGAAYMASMLGGIFGAVVLAVSIFVLGPLVLAFESPEFFMLGIFGITMVGTLSGKFPLRGISIGFFGLLLAMIGLDPQIGLPRWTFNSIYLLDGLPLITVALGIFAIPEIADMVIKGTQIADVPKEALGGRAEGIRDAFRNWALVLRGSAMGVWIGAIPGLGGSVVDWFAYGQARQTCKGASETFGKGDVRGVIAPECANNAKDGGALIPTILFGIPGSGSMAVLLVAFMIMGLKPGPAMITTQLDKTYLMIWSLAVANVFGTGICLFFTPQLAKVASIRIHLLAPVVVVVVFLAAFQATRSLGDLVALIVFSLLGWSMKRAGWSRPPLILGLVLGSIIETRLYISLQLHGAGFLLRPVVLVILLLIIATVGYGAFQERRSKQQWVKVPVRDED